MAMTPENLPDLVGEYVGHMLTTERSMAQVTDVARVVKLAHELLLNLLDGDPQLVPELEAISDALVGALAGLVSASQVLAARHDVAGEKFNGQ